MDSDWLWLPVFAGSVIVLAAMVVTGAAAGAAFVVPYRRRTGRTERRGGEVRRAPRSSSLTGEPAPGPNGAKLAPRSFGEAAWGGLSLGTDVETRSA